MFESSVILSGSQTDARYFVRTASFESSVILSGSQTKNKHKMLFLRV